MCGLNWLQVWLEHFFCNILKKSLKSGKFWRIFEKKKIEIFIAKMDRSLLVQNQKMLKLVEILKKYCHNRDLSIYWPCRV